MKPAQPTCVIRWNTLDQCQMSGRNRSGIPDAFQYLMIDGSGLGLSLYCAAWGRAASHHATTDRT
jgi:hypothetical protein